MSVLSNKADLTVFVLIIYAALYLSYFAASFFMPLPTNSFFPTPTEVTESFPFFGLPH